VLALRWRVILYSSTSNARSSTSLQAVHRHIGVDPDYINHRRVTHRRLLEQARAWESQVRQFFAERDLNDVEEFITSRTTLIDALKTNEWADDLIPVFLPRTAR